MPTSCRGRSSWTRCARTTLRPGEPGRPLSHRRPRRHSHAPGAIVSRFELDVALRYRRSRHASRLLWLIAVIAVGGVTVGAMPLIVVVGVMSGLQADLRDKVLVP